MKDRDLDAQIEQELFGNEVRKIDSAWDGTDYSTTGHAKWNDSYREVMTISGALSVGGHRRVKEFSGSISEAWLVVEKMRWMGFFFALGDLKAGRWHVRFKKTEAESERVGIVEDSAASRAICLAALKAIGVKVLG